LPFAEGRAHPRRLHRQRQPETATGRQRSAARQTATVAVQGASDPALWGTAATARSRRAATIEQPLVQRR